MVSTGVLDAADAARGAAPAPSVPSLRAVGYAATAYLTVFALALLALMRGLGGLLTASDLAWAVGIALAPIGLALRLTTTRQADRQQYLVRLLACALMLPLLVLMWASSEALEEAPVVIGLAFVLTGALHLIAFVAAIFSLAARVTRITPAAGVAAVGGERLAHRLASLGASAGSGSTWRLDLPALPGRQHEVRLTLDAQQPLLHVRERLSAAGAVPQSADEASLRGIGDAAFDPTRPNAQRVWSLTLQASMIDPQRLSAVPLRIVGDDAVLPPGHLEGLDADGWLALLAALATASGYTWQPGIGRLP